MSDLKWLNSWQREISPSEATNWHKAVPFTSLVSVREMSTGLRAVSFLTSWFSKSNSSMSSEVFRDAIN